MTPRRPVQPAPDPLGDRFAPLVDIVGRAIIEPYRTPAPGDPVAEIQRVLWEALLEPPP